MDKRETQERELKRLKAFIINNPAAAAAFFVSHLLLSGANPFLGRCTHEAELVPKAP